MIATVLAVCGYVRGPARVTSATWVGRRGGGEPWLAAPAQQCWNPQCGPELPDRWRKVHDCDRPKKWRELLDEEDCEIFHMYRDEFEPGPGAVVDIKRAAARRLLSAEEKKYTQLVPSLATMDEFLDAARTSEQNGRLMVVKFYSRHCRTCLRIAAKYRRLAVDLRDSIDCYEVEQEAASGRLLKKLDVTRVPSIQIFDGRDVTRMAAYACKPSEWRRIDKKVRVAMVSMQKRRGLHKLFGKPLLDMLLLGL